MATTAQKAAGRPSSTKVNCCRRQQPCNYNATPTVKINVQGNHIIRLEMKNEIETFSIWIRRTRNLKKKQKKNNKTNKTRGKKCVFVWPCFIMPSLSARRWRSMDQLSSRTPINDDGGYEPLQTEAQSTTTCALKRQQKQQQLAVHLKIEKKSEKQVS